MTTTPDTRLGATPDGREIAIVPRMGNRHGLIAGATGTGKTVTLQVLVERFSDLGVPCFVPDIKGDFSGIAVAADPSERLRARAESIGTAPFEPRAFPVVFWEVAGQGGARNGHPLRLTIADFGPQMLARLLGLNDTQTGVIDIVFRVADDEGLLLLDLTDLRAMLAHVAERRAELGTRYGNIAPASVGAIQRALLRLERHGEEDGLFGEPAVTLDDFLQTAADGRGVINILHAEALYRDQPTTYATVLLWLLSALFEQLPEVGDADQPVFALFLDEAHLLFRDTPKALTDRIEQVVRLVRSKGVGVYFITQSPLDLPEAVLGQLGQRVQHALRAFTPRDQRAVRVAAETFRPNPELDTASIITQLGVGEALVSILDARGTPTPVEHTRIRPPVSRIGPISTDERGAILRDSVLAGAFDQRLDRESAHEILAVQAERALDAEHVARTRPQTRDSASTQTRGNQGKPAGQGSATRKPSEVARATRTIATTAARTITRSIGSRIGREIVRGLLGSLTGQRK